MEYIDYLERELESYHLSPKWSTKIVNTPHENIILDFSLNLFTIETLSLFKNLFDENKCLCGKKPNTLCYGPFNSQKKIIKSILHDIYPDITKEITLKEILIAYLEYHKKCHIYFVCKSCSKKKQLSSYDINQKPFNIYKVKPDGHCFFSCISICCNKSITELREIVSEYMINYKSDFVDSYEPDENNDDTYEEFVNKIRNTNEWADNLVIVAMQLSLQISIEIYYENDGELLQTRNVTIKNEKKPIKIIFNGTNHYDLLYENKHSNIKNKVFTKKELLELTVKDIKTILIQKNIDFDKHSKKSILIETYLNAL